MGGVIFIVIVVFLVPIIVLVVYHNRISKVEHDLKMLFHDVRFLKQQFFKTDTYSEIVKQHAEARSAEKQEHVIQADEITESVDPGEINIPAMVEPVSEFTYIQQNEIEDEIPDIKVEQEVPTVDIPQERIPFINETPRKTSTNWFANKELESLIGGKLLNRIGSLALIIGIGFFLKYAFDKNWISEWVRVGIGFVSGFALIIGGWQFNKRDFKIFSQGLIGAGIATLFLSVFASFNFYHLVPQIVAFIMMSAITAFTFWLGIKYNSMAVAILGWLGGFLTPFMLSTGQANEIGLFTYVSLLDIGILLIFIKKNEWEFIYPMVLVGTYLTYFAWFSEYYNPRLDVMITSIFLIIFWILFVLVEFYAIYSGKIKNTDIFKITNVISLVIFYSNLNYVVDGHHHAWMGLCTLIIAVVYFGLFRISSLKNPSDTQRRDILLISSAALFVIATFIQFKDYVTVAVLAGEAVIFLYFGLNKKLKVLNKLTMITFGLAVIKFIISNTQEYTKVGNYWIILNPMMFASLSIAVAAFLCSFMLKKQDKTHYLNISEIYSYLWSISLVYLIFNEITNYHTHLQIITNWEYASFIESTQKLTYGFSLLIYAIPLIYYGFRTKTEPAIYVAFGSICIGVVVTLIGGTTYLMPEPYQIIMNYSFLSFLIVIISLAIIYVITKRSLDYSQRFSKAANAIFTTCILFVIIPICSEISVYHEHLAYLSHKYNLDSIYFNRTLTYAFSLVIYSVPLIYYGFKTKTNPAIYVALGCIAIGVLITVFGGFAFDPINQFNLIMNYRFLAFSIVIISTALILNITNKNIDYPNWMEKVAGTLFIMFILMIVILISAETSDYFNKIIENLNKSSNDNNIKFIFSELSKFRNMQQLSLSGIWIFYSIFMLMIGIWRRIKLLRLLSIGLFGVTILKVFVFDLSFLETLYRIISFIALGLILLTVSYLYQRYKSIILEK
jgi:hypothetical protein